MLRQLAPELSIAQKPRREGRQLAETRRREIAEALRDTGSVTVAEVEARFGVSPMTARRDLAELERRGLLRRTHGGAVLRSISAHEDSFAQRVKIDAPAKRALAEAAVAELSPGETVFLDSSTTTYFVARRMAETGLAATVLTNSLPVMQLLLQDGGPNLELIGIGGSLRRLTRSFVGPFAIRTILGHFADRMFFSVKGLTEGGVMTDADPLEAEVKRSMIAQANAATLLIDHSKLGVRGLSVIGPVSDLSSILACGLAGEAAAALRASGTDVHVVSTEPAAAAPLAADLG